MKQNSARIKLTVFEHLMKFMKYPQAKTTKICAKWMYSTSLKFCTIYYVVIKETIFLPVLALHS